MVHMPLRCEQNCIVLCLCFSLV